MTGEARRLAPRRRFTFQGTVPGDKSVTHRAYLFAALGGGETEVVGALRARDTDATLGYCQALGAHVDAAGDRIVISGPGKRQEPSAPVDCMNAGTLMRLGTGVLAGAGIYAVLTGDDSLRRRPMDRVVEPLKALGARIEGRQGGRLAPLTILPAALRGARISLPLPSAQVKSAMLLAALDARGATELTDLVPTRDHTERMLRTFGVQIEESAGEIRIEGQQPLRSPGTLRIPGDFSHAAFLLAAAALAEEGHAEIRGVGLNPGRTGLLGALREMGAEIAVREDPGEAEPVGTVTLHGGRLRGIALDPAVVPSMIDELPAFAAVALCAQGRTVVRGAKELRVKESDRIQALGALAAAVGGRFEEYPDGFAIEGQTRLPGGRVESFGDHRIAMAGALLALRADGPLEILGADAAAVSFPEFFRIFAEASE